MAELSSTARKHLPDSAFAGPGRSYPVNDRSHAANAKSRATQQENNGNLSHSAAAHIRARANAILDHHNKMADHHLKAHSHHALIADHHHDAGHKELAHQHNGLAKAHLAMAEEHNKLHEHFSDAPAAESAEGAAPMNGAETADASAVREPQAAGGKRDHALAMASATHLHKAGYIDRGAHDKIHKHARKKIASFGSMAPRSAGHYMNTPTPVGADEGQ
jgi:hypothetical protein